MLRDENCVLVSFLIKNSLANLVMQESADKAEMIVASGNVQEKRFFLR